MDCPKCQSPMEKIKYESIEVDRCIKCRGIWFDSLEKENLKELKGSEDIDAGRSTNGKDYNKIDRIECPVCHTQMIKMVDLKQPHIWYESCAVCYGCFFDAGEFKDYKEENFIDFFKDLLVRERK